MLVYEQHFNENAMQAVTNSLFLEIKITPAKANKQLVVMCEQLSKNAVSSKGIASQMFSR